MNTNFECKRLFFAIMMVWGLFGYASLNGQNLVFNTYINEDVVNSEDYIKGNVYQKDFLLFVDLLKDSHPAFAQGNDFPFNVDSVRQDGYKWAYQCKSINDLKAYMQSVATLLNDAHTTLLPEVNNNLIYPFVFFKDDSAIYMRALNKGGESFLGKRIFQINGHPVLSVLNSFKRAISSDNEAYFENKVNNYMQLYSMWENNPFCRSDSLLQFIFEDGTALSLSPVTRQNINLVWKDDRSLPNPIRDNKKTPFQYKLLSKESICYLQFNSCMDQSSARLQYYMSKGDSIPEAIERKLLQFPRFDNFLGEMFQAIHTNGIKTLVVDVRDNSGGNSSLCDVLLSWLKPLQDLKKGTSWIRVSKLWEQCNPSLAQKYHQAYRENNLEFNMGELYDTASMPPIKSEHNNSLSSEMISKLFVKNVDENKVFKGNVVFIQNSSTFSSAGLLITNAVDNNIGTLIGDNSSYRPCGYGDLLSWELPNTKIRGYVSHKIFSRPDGDKCGESSLTPTVYLANTWEQVLENKDACWEWVLNNYVE